MKRSELPRLLVSVARNRTLSEVLRAIVGGLAQDEDVVLARVWLEGPGDQCAGCRFREECPDKARCLHLVASAGNARGGGVSERLDGGFRRFPLGVRKIGRVARSGEPLLLPDIHADEGWFADLAWARREGVRAFAAQPLCFHDQVLGVLALFDRGDLSAEDFEWLRVLADHAAVSIANARAFEEIQALQARLQAENSYLREEVSESRGLGDLVGSSAGLARVLKQLQLVAPTNAPVLVTGESGTGKELVARALHENSPRRAKPFIRVNCGAIPETLFESEFFGHARGAFTGALRDRPGRFELADGGTLLLDEVGEIPLAMQAKLLRVLQEQEVERVGESRLRKLDVRVVAATNRDLAREVEAGRFRQDLFYRLSVFPLELPPLRARPEDIAPLAAHFVAQAARRMNVPAPPLSHAALAELQAHSWPGNIRELQNAVERALILARGGPLRFDLQSRRPGAGRQGAPAASPPSTAPLLTRAELRQRERSNLLAALEKSGGKVSGPGGAAELLGMRPTTLASRLAALGIERKR